MGSGTISSRSNETKILQGWFNDIRSALIGNIVPRLAGVATDLAGSLGSLTYRWRRLEESSGGWSLGDIKLVHRYGTTVSIGAGWMLCDGRQITQAAYDAEHGAGAWASQVGSTGLEGRYLPNLVGRYPRGTAATTSAGLVPIPTQGNAGNQMSLQHTHEALRVTGGTAQHFDSSGNLQNVTSITKDDTKRGIQASSNGPSQSLYTSNALASPTSIQPESIEVIYAMRVI